MKQPITVVCGDTHLQDGAWNDRPIRGDSEYSLEQIIDYTLAQELTHVIGVGDLIDKQVNGSAPIYAYVKQLERLHAAGGVFDFLQGQHDMQATPWLLNSPAARHMHKLQVELLNGAWAYGLDYQPAGRLQAELDEIPAGTSVLCAHQVWHEFMGDVAAPQGSMADVPVVDTVISGDYHVAAVKNTRGKDGQPVRLISPGSTCMQSIDEPVNKGFLVLYDDMTFDHVPLVTRRMVELAGISHPSDADTLISQVLPNEIVRLLDESAGYDERIRKPIVRVVYSAEVPDVRRRVMEAAAGRVHLFFKENPVVTVDDSAAHVPAVDTGEVRPLATLSSSLNDYLIAKNLERLTGPCRRLLDTHDVAGELSRLKEEHLAARQ